LQQKSKFKGDDEDSLHERGVASAESGSGCHGLEAPAEAVAEFPSELTGERASVNEPD